MLDKLQIKQLPSNWISMNLAPMELMIEPIARMINSFPLQTIMNSDNFFNRVINTIKEIYDFKLALYNVITYLWKSKILCQSLYSELRAVVWFRCTKCLKTNGSLIIEN